MLLALPSAPVIGPSTAACAAARPSIVRWRATLKGPLARCGDAIYPSRGSYALPPPLGCPSIICEYGALTSDDGRRPRHEPHNGIDIGAAAGTPVIAAAPSTIISAATQARGGNVAVLYHGADRHDHHLFSAYAHLACFLVARGFSVARGAMIGLVGRSGEASVPHLHFTVFINESDGYDLNTDGTLFVTAHTIVSPHLFALTETVDGLVRWRAWCGEYAEDTQMGFSGFTYPVPINHS